MARITKSHQIRSGTLTLTGALTKCRGIGKLLVIEDIVDVYAFDARIKTIESGSLYRISIDVLANV